MSVQDVFAAPKTDVRDMSGGQGVVTDTILTALRKTRPWVLFIAILGFIGSAFMALGSIPMLMGSAMMAGMEGMEAEAAVFGGSAMIGMGIMYLVIAVVYFIASLYLLRYAGAIKRVSSSLSTADLEAAINQQASFWKLMGILTLTTIVLVVVMLAAGIGGAIFMGGAGA